MNRRMALLLAPWAFALCVPLAFGQPARGSLGFTVDVDSDGSALKPVLVSARVAKVRPGSAAERGGLTVGDEILEVQGQKLPGANARDIAALIEVRPGQTLRLRVRRGAGDEHTLVLVAANPVGASP